MPDDKFMPDVDTSSDGTGDDSLRHEIMERYRVASTKFSKWEEAAKEDYAFALGQQWAQEDLEKLKEQGRPALTFNRIRPIVNLISGYQRENSSRIKVNPEGGEDRIFSEIMDRTIKAIGKWSHLDYKLGYLFDDGCYCGKGWLEGIVEYDKDPVRGQLNFIQRSPYQIMPDPECNEYDINAGADYCFKVVRLTVDKLKILYPSKKSLIDGFTTDTDDPVVNSQLGEDDDYGNKAFRTTPKDNEDPDDESDLDKDGKFTVKEYWRKKYVKRYFVINKDDGEPEKFESKELAQAFVEAQQFGKVIERTVPEVWVAAFVCGHVLQDAISPLEPYYSGFPFFRFMADWAPNAENEVLKCQGITRPLKDPQREKNKSKSQNLHILNTQANSGWVGDDNALSVEGKKKLEQMGSKPGICVWKKPGTELREILPKAPNSGHIQREQQADEEFKQISGINPDLMGMQEGTASGRAISMRIKQAILSLTRLFVNYRYTKEIIGVFILEMIPMLFDARKMSKVLGPDYMAKAVDPQKYPQGLDIGHLEAFLQMVADNKYDVYVTEAGQNATVRYEIFTELTELIKAGMPIPTDLVIDYMDLPNSEEVKQKIAMAQQQAAVAAQSTNGKPGA